MFQNMMLKKNVLLIKTIVKYIFNNSLLKGSNIIYR